MPDRKKVLHELDHQVADADWCDNDWKDNVPIWMLRDALALLREQEPLKPFYCEADDSWGCGNCGETVGYGELNPGGIDPVRNKYCPGCGRAVKWD